MSNVTTFNCMACECAGGWWVQEEPGYADPNIPQYFVKCRECDGKGYVDYETCD